MKLIASTSSDLDDLTRMLGAVDAATVDAVRAAVRTYLPVAVDDLERLISLGRQEEEET